MRGRFPPDEAEDYVRRALFGSGLTWKQFAVANLFYKGGMRLCDVGRILGVSGGRVRQIKSSALWKMRRVLERMFD